MQKHRAHLGKRRWQNANRRLSESAVDQLVSLGSRVAGLNDDFVCQYLNDEYLSKFLDESSCDAATRRSAAISKWLEQELVNKETNRRLAVIDEGFNVLPRVSWKSFMRFTRSLIQNVLGPLRDSIVVGDFSSGASTSRRRTEASRPNKFAPKADLTSEVWQYLPIIDREAPLFGQYSLFTDLRSVEGAILFTVPKKSDIDRCACKEPDINMFLQKGVGAHIRKRLRRFGIDLNDQSRNRELAREGSLLGTLATLDLSSASDSITIETVRQLLPSEWFLYLNDIRSQAVSIDGELHRTEMFSSMGNGFTFELESLIFWALMRATSYFEGIPGVISVYGDDIIIPSTLFPMGSWVLRLFGFSVNPKKSFHEGPFRESCGGHYYNGIDVTPFYLKRKPTHLTDLIRVVNQFRRWVFADPFRRYELPATYNMWLQLASLVPKDLWGGDDYALDTQLVAPVSPISRLVRVTGDAKVSEVGRYIAWHHSNRNRMLTLPSESFPSLITETRCRKRRVVLNGTTLRREFFVEEL